MRFLSTSLLTLLLGCTDYTMNGVEKRQPQMLVHPAEIDFGNLDAGTETGHETFTIINTGDEDLIIFAPELVSGNTRYAIDSFTEETITIAGGELLEVNVWYNPETFETNGAYVSVEGNDETNPDTKVLLTGAGDAPVIDVSPSFFDYGDISIGCDNEERITIRNSGNQDLIVDSVTQMVTQPVDILMEMGSLPPLPWTILPGQEVDFLVSYIPTDIGADASDIEIVSNDPVTGSVEVSQEGTGDVEQWYQDVHIQEEIPIVDVLWVIDNSGSMNMFQNHLSANVSSFMSVFVNSGADYHMTVITTDSYDFTTMIDSYTANAEAILSNLVMTGIMGSGWETGLHQSYLSLQNPLYAGPGGNFFRDDATLVVIYVSDEPDYSPLAPGDYLSFFDQIKPQGMFVPYGVIGDYPSGCQYTTQSGQLRNAQFGGGYYEVINHYGGQWYSICAQDWGVQLQDLAGEVTSRRTFELSERDPMETTIEVRVNGQISTDWTYNEDDNTVVFNDGHIPREGQTITIDFATWGCGE